jgi:hypothetical protein
MPTVSRPARAGTWFGNAMLLAFAAVQICDGAFTYLGVRLAGSQIEANPIIASSIDALGPAAGIATTKALAMACAGVLYVCARHRTLGVLTILYLTFAVWPWSRLLADLTL